MRCDLKIAYRSNLAHDFLNFGRARSFTRLSTQVLH